MGDVERGQLDQVADLARRHGVLYHHCTDSRHCEGTPGLPDVLLAGDGGLLLPELKARPGLTGPQTIWFWTLRSAGVNMPTWLDSDFRDGTVEREIARLRQR
jgi:hypothetical protein